jgi:6-phosphogluconolactonase (cycloisomerase 2 family)
MGGYPPPPQVLAVAGEGRFVYVADSSGNRVLGYTVDGLTGTLVPVQGSPFSTGVAGAESVVVDASGQFVYVGRGDGIGGYRLNQATGTLTELAGSPFHTAVHSRTTVTAAVGSWLYAAHWGGPIEGFQVNGSTGALTAVPGSPFTTGSRDFPYAVAADPSGRFLYLANLDAATNLGNVVALAIDSGTGTLTAVPGSPFGASNSPLVAVAVDPSGTFVYAAGNTADGAVFGFLIDSATGALTPVPGSPFPTGGGGTIAVAVDPSGEFVYAANYGSSNVSVFRLDAVTGSLSAVDGSPFGGGEVEYNPAAVAVAGTTTTAEATLTSLAVTPANPAILTSTPGATQQFIAVGTFSDGSRQYLTSSVAWTSDAVGVATISPTGRATTTGFGTATITATLGGHAASTTLTVTAATLLSITLTPQDFTISQGTGIQFFATGYFSDGTTVNITNLMTWESSAAGVAVIDANGLATSVAPGSTTITATLNGVTSSTTLFVEPRAEV